LIRDILKATSGDGVYVQALLKGRQERGVLGVVSHDHRFHVGIVSDDQGHILIGNEGVTSLSTNVTTTRNLLQIRCTRRESSCMCSTTSVLADGHVEQTMQAIILISLLQEHAQVGVDKLACFPPLENGIDIGRSGVTKIVLDDRQVLHVYAVLTALGELEVNVWRKSKVTLEYEVHKLCTRSNVEGKLARLASWCRLPHRKLDAFNVDHGSTIGALINLVVLSHLFPIV